jgi:hypothetical protein
MTINFGTVPAGSVLPIFFTTYAGATGASITLTGLAVTDIEVYKGTSMTQRASDAGYALMDTDGIDVDGVTGFHGFSIDTGDNTDASFYSVGGFFTVLVSAITVDGQNVNFIAATFRLGAAEAVAGYQPVDVTHISGDSSAADALEAAYDETAGPVPQHGIIDQGTAQAATSTTLQLRAAASFADDEIIGAVITITGGSAGVGQSRQITDYVSSTDTATVDAWTVTPTGTITYQVHACPPASSIPPDVNVASLDSGAVAAIQSGLALASDLAVVAADVTLAKATTDKLDTTLQAATGSPGDWEFRADALRRAPTGSGGSGGGASETDIAAAVWAHAGRTLTALDEDSTTIDLDNTIRSAVGLASANLDTQLAAIDAKTANLPSDPADQSLVITATTAIYDRIGAPAGASVSEDVAAVKAQTAAIETDTQDLQSRVPAALVSGRMDASVGAMQNDVITAAAVAANSIDASALASDAVAEIADAVWDEAVSGHTSAGTFGKALDDADDRGSRTVIRATVGTGSTTTSIVTSAFSPAGAAADQFKGRIVIWDNDTATAELRGQATDITASSNSATPTLTVTQLTHAPASGDTFSVV